MTRSAQLPLPCALVATTDPVARHKTADILARHGYAVAGPFTWADAIRWVEGSSHEVAVLEFASRNAECLQLARNLVAVQKPLVFYAEAEELGGVPAELKAVPFVSKPDREFTVLRLLSTMHNERLVRQLQGAWA
jgi:hypothetical protein